jgi:spermidine/putrescine transport system substrate-binding protein
MKRHPLGQSPASRRPLSRRGLLGGGLAVSSGLFLAACGGGSSDGSPASGSSSSPTALGGTINFLNYPDWIGKTEVADFEKANPGIKVKQTATSDGGDAAIAAQVAQNKGAFDMLLAGCVVSGRLDAGKLLATFDPSRIPNLANIDASIKESFPWGIPTDQGKVGIGLRKDLVSTPPTSWKELFDMLPDYSGKVVFPNFDRDVFAIALLALGFDVNATEQSQLEAARDLIIKAKPHLQAFLSDSQGDGLKDGSAVMSVFYDYSYSYVAPDNKNITWVEPSEGLPSYVEGWVPIAGTKRQGELEAFMNYQLDPKVYGSFINTTQASYLMTAAEPYIDDAIKDDVALKYKPATKLALEKFVSADAEAIRNKVWEQVKAA